MHLESATQRADLRPQLLPELFIAHESLGAYNALRPEMANRTGRVAVLKVNEFFIARKEVARFKVRIPHSSGVDLFLVELEEVRSICDEVFYQFLLVPALGRADHGDFIDGLEEIVDPLLEVFLD